MLITRSTLFKSAIVAALISTLFSFWVYWGSNFKIEQLLSSREWQSHIVALIDRVMCPNTPIDQVRRVNVTSNVRYLPNKTYIRVSTIKVYAQQQLEMNIHISESGSWLVSDGYLRISPSEFRDLSTNQKNTFTQEQIDIVTQFFKREAQQSRRIDVVDANTLLLVSLDYNSVVLFAIS
jgi:transmembrane regulatory protein ToxS